MKILKHLCMAACLVLTSPLALSQEAPPTPPPPVVIERPDLPELVPLYPDSDVEDQAIWENFWEQVTLRNVTRPGLIPYLPESDRANGQAIIVVPGGGYKFLSMENEGDKVARRLADEGFAAFILEYRIPLTPVEPQAYLQELARVFGNLGKGPLPDHKPAVDDLAAAVRLVAGNAPQWNVDPETIGVVGFSAGSRTTIRLIEQYPEAELVDNVALIYPPMANPVEGEQRPPLFLAIAVDDPLFQQGGLSFAEGWLAHSRDIEFHLYSGGSHGFGMQEKGTTSDLWIENYLAWLRSR